MSNNIEFYPENISKLKELTICSNKLIGGGDLIKIKKYVPLIIGNGIFPKVWLNIERNNKTFTLIKNNYSLNNQISIIENESERSTILKTGNIIILNCKLSDDFICLVSEIDLRPIGLNIFGNNTELNIGDSKLSNNTVIDTAFLIGME